MPHEQRLGKMRESKGLSNQTYVSSTVAEGAQS